ncbi:MAG: hypothetical protein ABEN55_06180 [Bradymonadaceae bacterium]
MPDRTVYLGIVCCIGLLVGLPTGLRADQSFETRIEGTWEATTSDAKAREKIDGEIDELVAKMFFFKRPFARSQLREATQPCSTIRIELGDDDVTMQCDDRQPTPSPKDGSPTDWTSADGETYTLTQHVKSDRVVQTFDSGNGVRTNTYRLKDADTLVLDVELDSDQLPEPLTFERTFERAE